MSEDMRDVLDGIAEITDYLDLVDRLIENGEPYPQFPFPIVEEI